MCFTHSFFHFAILRKSLQTTSALSATSKLCFEHHAASFLVCYLIFVEYTTILLPLARYFVGCIVH
ncbi:Uncharacterised protein [Streptococcus pneumoniae]|nr:Uncharacterised protein [Streptococcus pneumoniae]